MATFVLVHPAWFGGWCWNKLAPLLRAAGHAAYAPTLTGLGERAHLASPGIGLGTNVDDDVNVMTFEDLDALRRVSLSSAGVVITAVADRAPERIGQVVYLDAFVPTDGQSMRDLIPPDRRPAMELLVETEGDGWLLPRFGAAAWEQFVPQAWQVTDAADLPFGHFTEPVHLQRPDGEQPHRVYVRCRYWPNPSFDRYAATAQSSPAWGYYELATPHLPYITHPTELSAVLLDVAG